MKTALFYDTETNGLPLFKEPSDHPDQPHLVQIAAHLIDMDKKEVINSIDLVVKPDGWEIPKETSDIHGITEEFAREVGVSEKFATSAFLELWNLASIRIGHNESFDARILRISIMRQFGKSDADEWKAGESECTMHLSTPIVKCPPSEKMKARGMTRYKNANLSEAYKHFTGNELENAHSAIVDVNACVDVYFAIKDMKKIV